MATSNYLEGLIYRPHGEDRVEETRSGIPIFDGTPHHFESWKLRVEGKVAAALLAPEDKREQEIAILGSKLLDGLSGEAAAIAKEFGISNLMKMSGPTALLLKMKEELMGHSQDEARELHNLGISESFNKLSRQNGESMISYIARRRRWNDRVNELSQEFRLSDWMLGNYLLMKANLDKNEILMVRTCCSPDENPTFEKIASTIKRLFRDKHTHEKGRGRPVALNLTKAYHGGWNNRRKWSNNRAKR